ncbi:Na+/H+ antiporter subunit E [Conexibacter sp. JD483]|uniref:Na+/H+ antiporter subunit E n=1 Tax=unclassified Conexibacter TaxID=2627773 RepID=UPI002717BFFC|nr:MULTISPECIES: Na+/H+ antiporter subunit E [unclassified Conexibacter]MDO8188800.1 Na+/H+ antiporter subunit E [Conexibacter sp. CPCC 205706]MDO8201645.1 Na+/H+ antiporter subunit E [Conexibacter sp. CPCC 205762]MDR9371329.1 Na+/H+ antiporter subunit E [Conexibacter sp. JD483]
MSHAVASRALAVVVLLGVWLLTLGSVAWGDVAVGVVLAVLLELGWRRRVARGGTIGTEDGDLQRPPLHRALLATPALVWAVLVEITRGTVDVAKYSLGIREVEHDGIVEIRLEGISEEGVAAWAFISTISPGELVLDVDEERGVLVIHALDASDPEAIRARHHDFYERYQRKVIP